MSDGLTPVLRSMLPVLIADAGRARAETLMTILADPLAFRDHLDDIHVSLGSASPGVAELVQLVDAAKRAVSTSSRTVEDQHVISQVVLRRFAEEVPQRGIVVARFNLAY